MRHKVVKAMGILSITLLCCCLLCGMWMGTHPDSDKAFHGVFCGITVGFALITQIVYMNKCKFCGK